MHMSMGREDGGRYVGEGGAYIYLDIYISPTFCNDPQSAPRAPSRPLTETLAYITPPVRCRAKGEGQAKILIFGLPVGRQNQLAGRPPQSRA